MSGSAPKSFVDRPAISGGHTRLSCRLDLGALNVRGSGEVFLEAAERVLGTELPATPNTWTRSGAHRVGWLGPDEWLFLSPYEEIDILLGTLADGLAHLHHAVTDVSDQYAIMSLAGTASREVLAGGCPLDFHPTVFKTGMCAQSHFLRTGIMVWQLDSAPSYEILAPRSAADYLSRALAASITALA